MLSPDLQAAGARQASARAPELIDLAWLQAECSKLERVLRLQYPEKQLPAQDEATLAGLKPLSDTTRALKTWSYLKHLYLCRTERRQRASEDAGAARTAARQLLRRDPVAVQLSNSRTVHVTSRSYLASYAIARHWARIQTLHDTLRDLEDAIGRVRTQRAAASILGHRRSALRRHARRLESAFAELYEELARHRMQLYAHAFTPTGAPATSADQAPVWWGEMTQDDDAALLAGIAAAGLVRWSKVKEAVAAEPAGRDRNEREAKPWQDGWGALFAALEKDQGLEPASYYSRDIYQTLAWVQQLPDLRPRDGAASEV